MIREGVRSDAVPCQSKLSISYLLGIFRALRQCCIARSRVLGVPGTEYPAAFPLEADDCLHLSQLVRDGFDVGQVAFTSGRGQSIDSLAERDSWWRVSDTSRLGLVVISREEIVFQVVKTRVGLLHEGDPAVPSGLGQFLLRDSDEAGVASIANRAVAKLSICRDRAKQDESACNVGDLVRVVDADAATDKEIDDACDGYVSALALLALPFWQQLGSRRDDVADAARRLPFSSRLYGMAPSRP